MKRKLLSILALLCLTASSAWADWTGGTYTATTDEDLDGIVVNADATLTINSGMTVTVTNGIFVAEGKTLSITGGGTLVVTGHDGGGGNAIEGNVIIIGGTVRATGGTGDEGGNGGNAFYGTLIFYGGTVIASGGEGGEGGSYGFGFERSATFKIDSSYYTLKGGANADPDEDIEVDDMWNYQYVTITASNAASGNCGTSGHESEVTWMLTADGKLTISGTGAMANYSAPFNMSPFNEYDLHASVKSVVIEEGVTHVGNEAFCMNLPNLASFNIAASVTSLGGSAICSLESLTTVTFAEGSQLKSIGRTTFNNCDALTSITLPASVTDIEEFVLHGCDNLTSVTLNSNPRIYNDHVFGSATVTMNLMANEGATGEYWTTFYNENYNFQAADGTQIFKAALSGSTLALTELSTDQIVTKNNAVILKSTASPIVLTLTTTDSNNSFSENSLLGVNNPAGLTASDPSTTYVLNKKTAGVGFYKLKAGKTVGVGKAYLTYPSTSAPEFLAFDETTSVADVRSKMSDVRGDYFDLQGRRVTQPTKGLYIVNGRKVVIK